MEGGHCCWRDGWDRGTSVGACIRDHSRSWSRSRTRDGDRCGVCRRNIRRFEFAGIGTNRRDGGRSCTSSRSIRTRMHLPGRSYGGNPNYSRRIRSSGTRCRISTLASGRRVHRRNCRSHLPSTGSCRTGGFKAKGREHCNSGVSSYRTLPPSCSLAAASISRPCGGIDGGASTSSPLTARLTYRGDRFNNFGESKWMESSGNRQTEQRIASSLNLSSWSDS